MVWRSVQPSCIIHIPKSVRSKQLLDAPTSLVQRERRGKRGLHPSLSPLYSRVLRQNTIHLVREIHYLINLDRPVFLFCCFSFLESGPGAYESGIMVSKAVEIYIQGKLLKPAGRHVCRIHTHNQNYMGPNIYIKILQYLSGRSSESLKQNKDKDRHAEF